MRWVQIAPLRVLQELPSKQHGPPSRPVPIIFEIAAACSFLAKKIRRENIGRSCLPREEERPLALMAYRSVLPNDTRHPCALLAA
jgi:hypothetical protein